MQSAKKREKQPEHALRGRPQRPESALLPAPISSITLEPPHPKEVRYKLQFVSAQSYKKAVTLADRYYWQAQMAVERREASLAKFDKQAQLDQAETQATYHRQVAAAQQRYRAFIEQAHARQRQALHQARQRARQAEDVYKAVLENVPGYGELQLKALALADARALTSSFIQSYRSSLGPDGLGDLFSFLRAFDRVLDHARDRQMVVPVQFAEAVLKGILQRQLRHLISNSGKEVDARSEGERLKQATQTRLSAISEFLSEDTRDATPPSIRAIFFAVGDWLAKSPGTPFDLALDRLKLDVEATARREQRSLEDQMKVAIQTCPQAQQIRPAAEAYQAAQRIMSSSEQAARNVLQSELVRIESALERELQMAEAMVLGMSQKQTTRIEQAKRDIAKAKKLVRRWHLEMTRMQEVGTFQRLRWRFLEGFHLEEFWDELQHRQGSR
ncbi:MAG: hypothetical protein VKP62_02475 [Candidatus Sericytochromatia bacterium]|nr:hypothetical protein [Candidatus Sericytochromatia bacterium]